MKISDIKNNLNLLTRWQLATELENLPKILQEEEEILAFCIGVLKKNMLKSNPYLGILIATSQRIFFLSLREFKKEFIEFSYSQIKTLKKEDFFFRSSLVFEFSSQESITLKSIKPKEAFNFMEKFKKKLLLNP